MLLKNALKFSNKVLKEAATKKIISWDFDGTLYDQSSNSLYVETKALYDKQSVDKENVMIICTYRSKKDAAQIDNFFKFPTVVATNGEDKLATLMYKFPFFEVAAHYDDDVYTVNDFQESGVQAYLVYDPKDPDAEEKLSKLVPGVKKFPIDKSNTL